MLSALGFAMAMQFKPDGNGGWLYRKDQTGEPIPATQAERDGYVRSFGGIVLLGFVLFFAVMIGLAFVMNAVMPDPSDNQGAVGAIVMAGIAMGSLYLFYKWFSHAPARAFADRAPVGPAHTHQQVFGRRLARGGYGKLALKMFGLMVMGVAVLWESPEAWWLPIGLPLVVGLAFAYRKWSIERAG